MAVDGVKPDKDILLLVYLTAASTGAEPRPPPPIPCSARCGVNHRMYR